MIVAKWQGVEKQFSLQAQPESDWETGFLVPYSVVMEKSKVQLKASKVQLKGIKSTIEGIKSTIEGGVIQSQVISSVRVPFAGPPNPNSPV